MRQLSYLRHGRHCDHLVGPFADDDPCVCLVGRAPGHCQRCGKGAHRVATVVQTSSHCVAAILLRIVAIGLTAAGEPLEGRKTAAERVKWG